MTKFPKRTVAPTKTEKWFGDHNPWLGGAYDMFKNKGNCTNFAYCEMSRLMGKQSKLPTFNAYCSSGKNWYDNCPKTFKKGKTPKLGAVIVYKHKGKNSGHVAIVQEIKSNGDLVLSMSGWKSFIWKTRTVKKSDGYVYSDYKLLGFVYCPVEFENEQVVKGNTYTGEFPKLPVRGYFKKGDKGKEVVKLQRFLNWANGCNLLIDGVFGVNTNTQVGKFQKDNKLTLDYKFGKKCLAKAKTIKK